MYSWSVPFWFWFLMLRLRCVFFLFPLKSDSGFWFLDSDGWFFFSLKPDSGFWFLDSDGCFLFLPEIRFWFLILRLRWVFFFPLWKCESDFWFLDSGLFFFWNVILIYCDWFQLICLKGFILLLVNKLLLLLLLMNVGESGSKTGGRYEDCKITRGYWLLCWFFRWAYFYYYCYSFGGCCCCFLLPR